MSLPYAKAEVSQIATDRTGQGYEKLSNGMIRLARVDSPKVRRRAISELRKAGVPKKIAFQVANQLTNYVAQTCNPSDLTTSSIPSDLS